MKHFLYLFFVTLLLASCSEKPIETDLLIVNATIVDVELNEVLSNKLIAISGDTIQFVDHSSKKGRFKAKQVLDAEGRYVMPGLWDNHVHFRGGESLVQENKDFLPLFLNYGITTVRDAGGDITTNVLEWRNQILEGNLEGPMIFTSGPKLDGLNPAWEGSIKVETEEDIINALDSLETIGADYVKMYDGSLSKETFYGIIREAEKRGLKTTGHMPLSADFMEAVDIGLDGSEHLYYPLKSCSPLADSLTSLGIGYGMMGPIAESYDPHLANQVFQKMGEKDIYVTPTLYIGKVLREILDTDHSQDSLLQFMGEGIIQSYQRRIESARRARERGTGFRDKLEGVFTEMIVPMNEAGVNLLAGSDCGAFNSYTYPGASLHGELFELVNAGLTPQQALKTSIINGPEFFNLEKYYGAVDAGKIADLILLDKNPLENIRNLSKIHLLIVKGKLYDQL
ncbi:MAG: amidohydrolase family protein [Cyclobacteriaceae bacterium]